MQGDASTSQGVAGLMSANMVRHWMRWRAGPAVGGSHGQADRYYLELTHKGNVRVIHNDIERLQPLQNALIMVFEGCEGKALQILILLWLAFIVCMAIGLGCTGNFTSVPRIREYAARYAVPTMIAFITASQPGRLFYQGAVDTNGMIAENVARHWQRMPP